MKKSFLLFPIMALTLTACTTYAPTIEDDIPPPAEVGTVSGGWQNTDTIEQPAPPVYQQEIPVSRPVSRPVSQVNNTFNIPRDANGKPDYSQIAKGSYTGDAYTVQKGDTLFFVSYLAGKDKEEIARLNNLTYPYTLSIGQVLRLK
ncbi:LysM peptidoglycan-binding domain-containing protein [Phocoenobacter atlanticus]|uniref:LysM peptidoglycan-binding domain-containing protein n=1 Tax=Phocoenobacter atlanticus TaxID=3416742 RepID=UPI00276AAF3E|nr:LysM peptidoglycan-binding domain-containing protein [Pasteurella atlantica]MDP8101516.1 LysM peptidoglycan-binding domain-containing protein [Pasteurella atlantica]